MAPIMAHFQQYEASAQLTALYLHSCHQQPDRSFWLAGYPMALCCRCYGVYVGATITSILALVNKLNLKRKWLILFLIITIIDIIINYVLKINTGNITRFFVGIVIGLLFTVALCYAMKYIKEKINYVH